MEDTSTSSGTTVPSQAAMMTTNCDVTIMSQKETEPLDAEAIAAQPSDFHNVQTTVSSSPDDSSPPQSAGTIDTASPVESDSDQAAISSEERRRLAKIGRRKRAKVREHNIIIFTFYVALYQLGIS